MLDVQLYLLIFIIFLAGYIVFLHIKLVKRDIKIENLLRQIENPAQSIKLEEIKDEKLFSRDVMNFIFEFQNTAKIYLHYTKLKSDAENIIKEGFRFVDSFYRTAFPATDDKLELFIKHNSKKLFGDYVVVICISNEIINYYNNEIVKAGLKNCRYENILTEKPPEKNDNSDNVYILPSKYIKGFFNHCTGEIIVNSEFDPDYSSPWFIKNLEQMKNAPNQSKFIV
ncbi:MAG TPA: hypothetical protein PLN06_01530 [Bacteroidales bacterium]|nr:hypothetical protein [Bacteroidales bacterium]HCI55676.1 hypothetical protein [Bacteroidales bacterium]HOU95293.1 hypothetical protein [Bacteroidales bacterium]HQG35629.1 hypothetical protein [Bacteroidales bacterium]HQG51939.1 hypothetical protein [Bacteroidales bacterium]